jgi:hypothetical protein
LNFVFHIHRSNFNNYIIAIFSLFIRFESKSTKIPQKKRRKNGIKMSSFSKKAFLYHFYSVKIRMKLQTKKKKLAEKGK